MNDRDNPRRPDPADRDEEGGSTAPEAPAGLAALIGEAEALHDAPGEARSRAGRLVAALRKQRRSERLVATTLASLRSLRFQDVAE